jgi:hypothetical protein
VLTSAGTGAAPTWTTAASVNLASPGPIGNTTPSTGAFTTVSAAGKISALWPISTGDGMLVRDTGDTSGASFLAFQNSSGGYIGYISRDALTNNMQLNQVSGITFPATQSASSNANTLDDYEEGTWTPVDASGASLSFSSAGGFYTKIGRQVICFFYVTYPATASTAAASIGGLPFTTGNNVAGGVFTGAVAYNTYGSMQLVGPSSVTSFNLGTPAGSDILNVNMTSKALRGSFLYFVA